MGGEPFFWRGNQDITAGIIRFNDGFDGLTILLDGYCGVLTHAHAASGQLFDLFSDIAYHPMGIGGAVQSFL